MKSNVLQKLNKLGIQFVYNMEHKIFVCHCESLVNKLKYKLQYWILISEFNININLQYEPHQHLSRQTLYMGRRLRSLISNSA